MASTRAAEYHVLIDEILADDAALRAQGLPGLDYFEIVKIRNMLLRTQRKMLANMNRSKNNACHHFRSNCQQSPSP